MKRSVKLMTVILVLSMIMSLCSCSDGGDSERHSRDESGKPEISNTDEVTDTEETEDTEESESVKETYPLGTGVMSAQEAVEICEQCIGRQADDAVEFIMASMGVSAYETYTLGEAFENAGVEYTLDYDLIIELKQFDRVPTIEGYPFYKIELITNIQQTIYQILIISSDSSSVTEEEKAAGQQIALNYPAAEAGEAFRANLTLKLGEPDVGENPQHMKWYDGDFVMSIDWRLDVKKIEGQNVFEFFIQKPTLYISPTPTPTPDPTDEIKESIEFFDSIIGMDLNSAIDKLKDYFGEDLDAEYIEIYETGAELPIDAVIGRIRFIVLLIYVDSQGNVKELQFDCRRKDREDMYERFTGPLTNIYGEPDVTEYQGSDKNTYVSTYTLSNGHLVIVGDGGFVCRNPAAT